MDCSKAGKLILKLRKEKNMTQRQIADALNISDKTISKWERGLGYPDVSLLSELSNILDVDIEKLLQGELMPNRMDNGNIRRVKFYVCPDCSNIMYSTGNPDISCCGRKVSPLKVVDTDDEHKVKISLIENDYFITIDHDMKKGHYISFLIYVNYDRVQLIKLYPEQSPELRIPRRQSGTFYMYCSKHGLYKVGKA